MMHRLAKTNKYVGFLFLKVSDEYFQFTEEQIRNLSAAHIANLEKYYDKLTHFVCSGLDARYDMVTLIEADTLEEINDAVTDFRKREKAKYIDIVNIIVTIKAPHHVPKPKSPAQVGTAVPTPSTATGTP